MEATKNFSSPSQKIDFFNECKKILDDYDDLIIEFNKVDKSIFFQFHTNIFLWFLFKSWKIKQFYNYAEKKAKNVEKNHKNRNIIYFLNRKAMMK